MKICHYIWGANFGGIWTLVRTVSQEQSQKHNVSVLFAQKDGGKLSKDNYEFATRIIPFRHSFDFNPKKIQQVKCFLKEFDIIHLHGITYPIYIAAILAKKPIVYTFHGLLEINRKSNNLRDLIKHFVIKLTFNKYIKGITTVSNFMREELIKRYKFIVPIRVIYNCIKEKPVLNTRYSKGITNTLLTFSRLVPNKRTLVFLEIIERLKEFGFKGKIFGDGPLKQQIVHEITARKLPINLFPFTSNIEAEIEDSNYCIFPAQSESFGISVLEVLRSGKIPIVFKDGGGLVEILKPIAKGRLIVNNVEQCVQLLLELNNETDLSVIQAELKDRLSDFFVSNIVQQYITFYNELIKNT